MLNPVTIKINELQSIDVSPQSVVEYASELKFRIKMLEDELKEYEPRIMQLAERSGGKLETYLGDITLCQKKEYQFSDQVTKLEQKRKELDAKIKARQIVEIAEGASCVSRPYLRYNVRIS